MAKTVTITVDENDNVSGLPDSEFAEEGNNGNGWKVKDKSYNTNDYSYTVQVQKTTSGRVLQHDPTIRNGGQN